MSSTGATEARLRISFLLADTPLFGGVKVVLHQANLLARRGHHVVVVSPGSRPDWYALEAEFLQIPRLDPDELPEADLTVATFWTTIETAEAGPGKAVHYCQGFEGSYTHNQGEHPAIEKAYSKPLPAIVVADHLVTLLRERFARPARVVRQPLEAFWSPRFRVRPGRPPRILVAGPLEIDWKGVATSLRALARLRRSGFSFRLERLSQWPLTEEERDILEPDAFHFHLDPPQVAELMRRCDLLIGASWQQEGFGLPVLEALACGVPVVASDVSCYRDFAAPAALLVPPRDVDAFAEAVEAVLSDSWQWQTRRRQGKRIARDYRERLAGESVEQALVWALGAQGGIEPAN